MSELYLDTVELYCFFTESSHNQIITLRDYLLANNKTISHLSRESGLPYTTLSEIVNGKKTLGKCSALTVYRIAGALGTTVESLLVSESPSAFSDLFDLGRKQSIFLAKKLWDENVYCGMRMEGRNVTFPQTKTILEGLNVPEVALEDIMAIINMRDAWKYLIESVDAKLDLDYICRLNSFIAKDEALAWGVLRTGSAGISGTDYKPPVPVREKAEADIRRILSAYVNTTDKALDLFCYITYSQLFWGGNKRTALTAANKLLISEGKGMLTIRDRDMSEFNVLLRQMYDTGEKKNLKQFLYSKALKGIGFRSDSAYHIKRRLGACGALVVAVDENPVLPVVDQFRLALKPVALEVNEGVLDSVLKVYDPDSGGVSVLSHAFERVDFAVMQACALEIEGIRNIEHADYLIGCQRVYIDARDRIEFACARLGKIEAVEPGGLVCIAGDEEPDFVLYGIHDGVSVRRTVAAHW